MHQALPERRLDNAPMVQAESAPPTDRPTPAGGAMRLIGIPSAPSPTTSGGPRGRLLAGATCRDESSPLQGGQAMRKRLRFAMHAFAIFTLGLVLVATAAPAAAQGKPIRIGEINSYSGLATVYTFPYKEGL